MQPQAKEPEFDYQGGGSEPVQTKKPSFSAPGRVTVSYKGAANDNSIAANDNETAANDNDRTPGSKTEAVGSAVKTTGTAMKATGGAAEVTGASMQAVGKVADVAGKGMQAGGRAAVSAGVALSSTGLGAIVGVPLAVLGGATTVAGAGTQVAGKGAQAGGRVTRVAGKRVRQTGGQVSKAGRIVKQAGRRRASNDNLGGSSRTRYLNRATNLIPNPVAKKAAQFALKNVKTVKATSLNVEIFAWATPFWLTFHMPLAVVSLALAGATYFFHDYLEEASKEFIGGETLYSIASWVGESANFILEQVFGFSLDPAPAFLGVNTMVFFLGLGVLIIMTLQYVFAGVRPFLGKGAVFKVPAFIFALFFYMMPFLNIFPWFMLWAAAVNLNPE